MGDLKKGGKEGFGISGGLRIGRIRLLWKCRLNPDFIVKVSIFF